MASGLGHSSTVVEAGQAQKGDMLMPKSMKRAKKWSDEVENAFRFQEAGYRDEIEYKSVNNYKAERWPISPGFVKKLKRKDGTFYYYNRARECKEKDIHKIKLYSYE